MRGLKENSISHKILIAIGKFLEETALPLLIWDFETIAKTTGIRSIYRDYSLHPPLPEPQRRVKKRINSLRLPEPQRRRRELCSLSLAKYFYDLKRRNYIKETKTKKGRKIELIPKGKTEIIKYKIKLKIKKPKWNKKWFAISWDIPETSRKDRDYLRGQLKWIGFKELQKSFWIFPYDIREEIQELIKFYKTDLMGDIRFLIIERIENDSDLRNYFKL